MDLFRRTAIGVLASALAPLACGAEGSIEIRGAEGVLDSDARERSIAQSRLRDLDCAAALWALHFRAGRLNDALLESFRDVSRLGAASTLDVDRTADCWTVTITLAPGPETRLRKIDVAVTGPGAARVDALLDRNPLQTGGRLEEGTYERFKRGLQEALLGEGYLEATFTEHRIDVYPELGAADIKLRLETGPQHHFGELHLHTTPGAIDPEIIERIVTWTPGSAWSRHAISNVRRELMASGYVDSVDLRSRPGADGVVAVDADITLQQRFRLGAGLGYATDVGPRAELSFADRYRNRRGHQIGADLRASPVLSSLGGEYRLPLSGAAKAWLLLEAGVNSETTDTVDAEAATLSARRVHRGPLQTLMTEFVELTSERFVVALDDEHSNLLILGTSLERSERTVAEPLELGWRVQTSVRGAGALSSTKFAQLRAAGEIAIRAGDRARWIARANTGTTWTESFTKLPPSLRFFAGGDRSIRGYGLDDVGPLASNGEVRGGRHLFVTSLEFEQIVHGRWSLAAFVDTGGAFNDRDDPWVTGVGTGVRWRSPIGPVRFDIAAPLDDPERNVRIHIGIGAQFR